MQNSIQVGCAGKVVWVRVEGKGSFLNSAALREFAREMALQRGFRDFVVDLQNCPVMDSTFMGTLAGIALRLRELGGGSLRIVRLNARNRDLLCNLGLDQLLTLEEAPEAEAPPATEALSTPALERKEQAQNMLEAHQALLAADPANQIKFKDVLEYLKQDLAKP